MIPKVYIVEDNLMVAEAMKMALADEEYEISVFENGKDCLEALADGPDIVCLDHFLPDLNGIEILKHIREHYPNVNVVFVSGQEDVNIVVEAYKIGAKSYIVKKGNFTIELKQAVANLVETSNLLKEVELLREELIDRDKYDKIIGESTAILKVLKLIQRVEKTDTLVMITGESGTGKELVAEAIHQNSLRRKKPFLAVNIAAIPKDLLEDELFGHEKGAFTGASSRRKGKFEEADGGTIFLDEFGEMDMTTQTKLLRVLQDQKISRLGSNKTIKLDVRIVAATNKNLGKLVKEGKFREDLYYRIQGFLIHLPPLRDRGNDVIVLAKHFLKEFSEKHRVGQREFDESAIRALREHNWTGNVRELIALVERCVLMSDGQMIKASDLVFSDSI
jgi:DNA-binding NtrC family response regulator